MVSKLVTHKWEQDSGVLDIVNLWQVFGCWKQNMQGKFWWREQIGGEYHGKGCM